MKPISFQPPMGPANHHALPSPEPQRPGPGIASVAIGAPALANPRSVHCIQVLLSDVSDQAGRPSLLIASGRSVLGCTPRPAAYPGNLGESLKMGPFVKLREALQRGSGEELLSAFLLSRHRRPCARGGVRVRQAAPLPVGSPGRGPSRLGPALPGGCATPCSSSGCRPPAEAVNLLSGRPWSRSEPAALG